MAYYSSALKFNALCSLSSWCMNAALVSNSPVLHLSIIAILQGWHEAPMQCWQSLASDSLVLRWCTMETNVPLRYDAVLKGLAMYTLLACYLQHHTVTCQPSHLHVIKYSSSVFFNMKVVLVQIYKTKLPVWRIPRYVRRMLRLDTCVIWLFKDSMIP